jgi:phage FluMu protein Com
MKTAVRRKRNVPDVTNMKVVRCAKEHCHSFLAYESIEVGTIQISCKRCKSVTEVQNPPDFPVPEKLIEARCASCGRFLYGQALIEGKVRVKCSGCGTWNTLDINPEEGAIDNGNLKDNNRGMVE